MSSDSLSKARCLLCSGETITCIRRIKVSQVLDADVQSGSRNSLIAGRDRKGLERASISAGALNRLSSTFPNDLVFQIFRSPSVPVMSIWSPALLRFPPSI